MIFMVFDFFMPKPQNQDLNGIDKMEKSSSSDVSKETPKVAQVEEPKLIENGKLSSPSKGSGTVSRFRSNLIDLSTQ